MDYLAARHLSTSPPPFSHMDLAARLEDEEASRAFICWNINPAASNPEQRRLQNALRRDDLLTVVLDVFETDTTDFADCLARRATERDVRVQTRHREMLEKSVAPPLSRGN